MPDTYEAIKQRIREKIAERSARAVGLPVNLEEALQRCVDSRELVETERANLRPLIERATTEIESEARFYQFDLISWQIDRAATVAEGRIAYLRSLRTEDQFLTEKEKCRQDVHYWFEMYAWGFDPRPDSPLAIMPLDCFPFQERYLDWLYNLVFINRSSGMVEKARDMGATVFALGWCIYNWLFRPYFSAMLSSATEDLVDSKKDIDTLFEKARFMLRLLPTWMLPKGFNLERDTPYMNISNPENGALITGAAPTAKVGRQRRRTVAICDEFQTWPFGGFPQYVALSQTAKSLIILGTPEGRFNKYAELRFAGHTDVFEMDWREHPWKDQRWYDSLPFGILCPAMAPQAIAQEIDRDYDASQPGKVFKNWREEYTCITQSELLAGFAEYGLDHHFLSASGVVRIPQAGHWGRAQDRGYTAGHPCVTTWMWRPPESFPLHDTVFVFDVLIAPTGAEVPELVPLMRDIETRLGLIGRQPELFLYSHEGKDERKTYLEKYGVIWEAWDTDYNLGIPQIHEWLTLVDTTQPNPFRPELYGRMRIVLVHPDGEADLAYNQRAAKHFVTPAINHAGFARARFEFPLYHYPPEELGKPLRQMRPAKENDDFIDTLRALACRWGPSAQPLNRQERVERQLEKVYHGRTFTDIMALPPTERDGAIHSYRQKQAELMTVDKSRVIVSPVARWRKRKHGTL